VAQQTSNGENNGGGAAGTRQVAWEEKSAKKTQTDENTDWVDAQLTVSLWEGNPSPMGGAGSYKRGKGGDFGSTNFGVWGKRRDKIECGKIFRGTKGDQKKKKELSKGKERRA